MNLLRTLAKGLGLTSWTGAGTIILAVGMAMAAAATWLREDGVNTCNAEWTIKLQAETAKLKDSEAAKAAQIMKLEQELLLKDVAAESAAHMDTQNLEKQRETVGLSKECLACRIPNSRLWLQQPGNAKVQPAKQSKPGS